MIEFGFENRCQIDTFRSQLFQVIEFFDNSTQIPAEIIILLRKTVPMNQTGGFGGVLTAIKSIGKYLVIDDAFCPFGDREHVRGIHIQKFEKTIRRLFVTQSVFG